MAISPMPPATQAAAPSPDQPDPFAQYVNDNDMIPVWLDPEVAHGVLTHFGRTGQALVHPHPASGHPSYATGGVVSTGPGQTFPAIGGAKPPAAAARALPRGRAALGAPPARGGPQLGLGPLAGMPRNSVFGGGPIGASGPADRTPVFVQNGGAIDGTPGMGTVPGVDTGGDTVPAMLRPGEAVFNKGQLAGIKPKPGKEHLLRGDQKQAMRKAGRRATRK